MKLIDTHAHLYWDSFKEDFDEVIQKAIDAGISTIINVGVDVEKSQEALDQARNTRWPEGLSVYSTIGIHPHEATKYAETQLSSDLPDSANLRQAGRGAFVDEDITKLEEIYRSNPEKVVAVGECGLDFCFQDKGLTTVILGSETTPESFDSGQARVTIKALQKKLLQAQIDLAKKLNLPLIVHCRDDRSKDPENSEAWDEVIKMVGDHPTILHCYSGLSHTTNYLLPTTNLAVSFAANITYPKNEYLREAAKLLPLDRILLETDSPFLAPQSKRGQRNEPASVKEIAQLIAELKGVCLKKSAEKTKYNAKKVLNI